MDDDSQEYKLVLLGESSVGKSSLVLRYCKDQFFDSQEPTIGAAFLTQAVQFNDLEIKLQIWDTAGQERYHSLAPMYYKGASAAIVVYDITNPTSFDRAKQWVNELQSNGPPDIVIAFAGNKFDLESRRKVEARDGEAYANNQGLIFMETSAKTGYNVDDIFFKLTTKLPKKTNTPNSFHIPDANPIDKPKKSCC
ncbi:ras-related protein rabf2b [Anaeramoeba ignava]|uniref:Ras-related protein rabf2b n=1 Tax=Anaeramoeba ignava TaxID=1746090 RepID=A0A9Q0LIS8_ANAIG|nr:ras-related protein rabf2b [Anaeramoeba ignava]